MESTLQQISAMKQSLLDEGFVDQHFTELELFQVGDNPQFFEEMVNLFLVDSARLIVNVGDELKNDLIDHSKVESILHQLKGSSSSIGASRVADQVVKLRESCNNGDTDGSRSNEALEQLKKELVTLKEKVDTYFQLLKQLGSEKKAEQHPSEGQVDELAENQLMKLAITEGEKEDSGHKEDIEKVSGEEPEVETEEDAANIENNGESVKAEPEVETEEAAANIENNGESVKAEPEKVETEEEAVNIVNKGESVKAAAE